MSGSTIAKRASFATATHRPNVPAFVKLWLGSVAISVIFILLIFVALGFAIDTIVRYAIF